MEEGKIYSFLFYYQERRLLSILGQANIDVTKESIQYQMMAILAKAGFLNPEKVINIKTKKRHRN